MSFYDLDSLQDQATEGPHLSRDISMKYDADIVSFHSCGNFGVITQHKVLADI